MAPKANADTNTEANSAAADIEKKILDMKLATAMLEHEAAKRLLEKASAEAAPAFVSANEEDEELRTLKLQTARLELEQARENNQKFIETREQKIEKRRRALEDLKAADRIKARIRRGCRHRVGGFGLQDTYRGGKENVTSIIESSIPIQGMKFFYCYRCGDEAMTPDRNLRKNDPEEYERQMEKFKRFEELMRDSYNSMPMGGPVFAFEKDGLPFHPTIV